jgi:hypothetical protein
MEAVVVSVIERSQQKGVKSKMRGRKLARGVKANTFKTKTTCIVEIPTMP